MARALRELGYEPLEVYPFATFRLLGLPTTEKRTPESRRRIHRALKRPVPGLNHPRVSEHQLDAVVCALTAQLWREGGTRTVGLPEEGLMTIRTWRRPIEGRDFEPWLASAGHGVHYG
jgi:predicted nuclease with RNAse H fold